MITVKLSKNELLISGHANQNKHGNDIVCASVSTAVFMSLNLIEVFKMKHCITFEINDGYTLIKVIEHNDIVDNILFNLKHTLKDLEEQYSKYVTIKEIN